MNSVITIQYYEDNTVIDTDFDSSKATVHMTDAHEINLNELLGDDLYARVQAILDDLPSASQIEKDLITCLKMFVVKATDTRLTPFLNTPVSAKGTQERSGDFTSSSDNQGRALRLDVMRASEEVFAEKCRKFLVKNIKEFPEYKCAGGNDFYSSIHFL